VTSGRLNADVPGPALRSRWPLGCDAPRLHEIQLYDCRLTRRGATRVHRLAWTVADLAGVEMPGETELDTALRLRTGEPLMVRSLVTEAGA
jgi:magnesium chelatase family protein